jgi:hypothetical protein
MNILFLKIIYFSSLFVWLFPAIRHFKRRFFPFFLLLALSDPLNMLFILFLNNNNTFLFSITSYLMVISVLEKPLVKRFKIPFTIIFLLITIISISDINRNLYYIAILVNILLVLLIFLKNFILIYVESKKIDLFLIVLIFYISTNLFKFLNVMIGFSDATAFFIITSIAQIAFGLFFSIFREDNPRLLV